MKTETQYATDHEWRFIAALYLFLGNTETPLSSANPIAINDAALKNLNIAPSYSTNEEVRNTQIKRHIDDAKIIAGKIYVTLNEQPRNQSQNTLIAFENNKNKVLNEQIQNLINIGRDFNKRISMPDDQLAAMRTQLESINQTSKNMTASDISNALNNFQVAAKKTNTSPRVQSAASTQFEDILDQEVRLQREAREKATAARQEAEKADLEKGTELREKRQDDQSAEIRAHVAAVTDPINREKQAVDKAKIVSTILGNLRNKNRTPTNPAAETPAIVDAAVKRFDLTPMQRNTLTDHMERVEMVSQRPNLITLENTDNFRQTAEIAVLIDNVVHPDPKLIDKIETKAVSIADEKELLVQTAQVMEEMITTIENANIETQDNLKEFSAQPQPDLVANNAAQIPLTPGYDNIVDEKLNDLLDKVQQITAAAKDLLVSDQANDINTLKAMQTQLSDAIAAVQNYRDINNNEHIIVLPDDEQNDALMVEANKINEQLTTQINNLQAQQNESNIFDDSLDLSPTPNADHSELFAELNKVNLEAEELLKQDNLSVETLDNIREKLITANLAIAVLQNDSPFEATVEQAAIQQKASDLVDEINSKTARLKINSEDNDADNIAPENSKRNLALSALKLANIDVENQLIDANLDETDLEAAYTKLADAKNILEVAVGDSELSADEIVTIQSAGTTMATITDRINTLKATLTPPATPTPPLTPTAASTTTASTTPAKPPRQITMKQQAQYINDASATLTAEQKKYIQPDFDAEEKKYGISASTLSPQERLKKTEEYLFAADTAANKSQMKFASTLVDDIKMLVLASSESNKANMQAREKLLDQWNNQILGLQTEIIQRVAALKHSQTQLVNLQLFYSNNLTDPTYKKALSAINKAKPQVDAALPAYEALLAQLNQLEKNLEKTSHTVLYDRSDYDTRVLARQNVDIKAEVVTNDNAKATLKTLLGAAPAGPVPFMISSPLEPEKKFDIKDEVAIFRVTGKDSAHINEPHRVGGKVIDYASSRALEGDTVAINHRANLETIYSMGSFNPITDKPQAFTLQVYRLREDLDPASIMAKFLMDEHKGMESVSDAFKNPNSTPAEMFKQLRSEFAKLTEKPARLDRLETFLQTFPAPIVQQHATVIAEQMHKEVMRVMRNPKNPKLPGTSMLLEAEHLVESYIAAREQKGVTEVGPMTFAGSSNKEMVRAAEYYCQIMAAKYANDPAMQSRYDYTPKTVDNKKMVKSLLDNFSPSKQWADYKTRKRVNTVTSQLFKADKADAHSSEDLNTMIALNQSLSANSKTPEKINQLSTALNQTNNAMATYASAVKKEIDVEAKRIMGNIDDRLNHNTAERNDQDRVVRRP